jgi:SAM-dependent methyltransferase
MSYAVEYINCKICGSDCPRFLGTRGNLEYMDAPELTVSQEHIVTSVVKCRKCGFIYANPMVMLPQELRSSFYDKPEEYHSSICRDELRVFNRSLNLIEKFADGRGKLLDVGSGKGEFLAAAKMRGWEVFGVEPALGFVRCARQKFGLDIQNSTLEEASFPENYFDAVTLNMTLEHIDNPHSLLSAIYRVLKKGGILYIEVPNMDSMLLKLIKLYFRLTERDWSPHISPLHYPYHCCGYTRFSVKLLCEMNKFVIRKFFIFGIGLRGFRPCPGSKFIAKTKSILAGIFGLINQGDILIAVAAKT